MSNPLEIGSIQTILWWLEIIKTAIPMILYLFAFDLRQVRSVKRGNVTGPLGKYTCEVPDMNGTIHRASIYITSSNGDSIIHSSN